MHLVTGGAYNGKTNWVKEHYRLKDNQHVWIDAKRGDTLPNDLSKVKSNVVVLAAIDYWLLRELKTKPKDLTRNYGKMFINRWADWEAQTSDRRLILIGNDISKGIVPIKEIERTWRDLTGWLYQDIAMVSDRVDYVWYGISKQLK